MQDRGALAEGPNGGLGSPHEMVARMSRGGGCLRSLRPTTLLVAGLLLAAGGPAASRGAGGDALAGLRAARKEMAHRGRRIIFNNDGCDCLYFPTNLPVTAENFLALRTTALAGSQVGAIAYCTISSGFSFFTHATRAGVVLERQGADYGLQPGHRNVAREMIGAGSDCLKANVDFARANGMEAFWSMRMNDTHDVAHRPDKPYLLYPPLKVEHPDWLVGEPVKGTPVGRWSSVDYARPEIRDLAFRFIEEVCRGYGIDGIELDFFRHPCFFRSVAMGGRASVEECGMVTDLVRRVRAMTEEVGLARGKPILVTIRVPDSEEYDLGLGLDVGRWLAEGLVDVLITSCYFRLNPWEYSVAWGHRHGVPVYACLSDSRVVGETRFRRSAPEAYRGEAMNAWAAGVDGIHLFNLFRPESPVFREVGDVATLRPLEKLYFVTVRDGAPDRFLKGGAAHQALPNLVPARPVTITSRAPLRTRVFVGEDFEWAAGAGLEPEVTCHLELPLLCRPSQVKVSLNGSALGEGKLFRGGWLDVPVPAGHLRRGANEIEVALDVGHGPGEGDWPIRFEGDRLPVRPWRRDTGSERTAEELVDGALRVADRGTQGGDYHYWRCAWGAEPERKAVVEARARVISGSSFLLISNGVGEERIGLWPDRVELYHDRAKSVPMDTAGDFHVYRAEVGGRDIRVYVDGVLRIDARGSLRDRGGGGRNEVAFGAANSPGLGEALWDYVRARTPGLGCGDAVVRVAYRKR